jgi:hypothetical protein
LLDWSAKSAEIKTMEMDPQNWQIHNARLALDVSQIGLCLFAGVVFAALSYVVWRVKGKCPAHYISQFIGIGFILLAVVFLTVKLANSKLDRSLEPMPHHSFQSEH